MESKKYFDIIEDWAAIESSFMYDYNIDLTKEVMSGRRFMVLLNNLSNDSAIGRIVISKMEGNEKNGISNSKPKLKWFKNGTKEILSMKKY